MKNWVLFLAMAAGVFGSVQADTLQGVSVPAVQAAQVEYPRDALRRGQQGEVLVQYRVNAEGRAEDIKVLESSHRVFNDAAVRAVRQSLYARTFQGDQPVEVEGVVQRFEFVFDRDR